MCIHLKEQQTDGGFLDNETGREDVEVVAREDASRVRRERRADRGHGLVAGAIEREGEVVQLVHTQHAAKVGPRGLSKINVGVVRSEANQR